MQYKMLYTKILTKVDAQFVSIDDDEFEKLF